jgi:hypothetical protein
MMRKAKVRSAECPRRMREFPLVAQHLHELRQVGSTTGCP